MTGDLLDLARRAAVAAGAGLLERFGGPASGLDAKTSRTDLVSDADRASEQLILGMIRAERPDDGILAEEGGAGEDRSGITWLVDPLDGTINFLWGLPQWSVTLAARDAEGFLVGVVHDPCRGETFWATRGGGAFLDGAPIRVREAPPLDEALIGTGFSYRAEERVLQAERLRAVLPAVRDVRRLGSAALDLAWVAAGRLDGYYETALNPWDWAGGAVLVAEAGGALRGMPERDGFSFGIVAAHPRLADDLMRLLGYDA